MSPNNPSTNPESSIDSAQPTATTQPGTGSSSANTASHRPSLKPSRYLPLFLLVVLLVAGLWLGLARHPKKAAIETVGPQISVSDSGFFPKTVQIKAGQAITWTNYGSKPHWIASDPYPKDDALPGLNSQGALQASDSYTYTFEHPGTYTYHDQLHPYKLQGTVMVK